MPKKTAPKPKPKKRKYKYKLDDVVNKRGGIRVGKKQKAKARSEAFTKDKKFKGTRTAEIRGQQSPSKSTVISGKGKGTVKTNNALKKAKADAKKGRKVSAKARLRLAKLTGQRLK